MPIIAPTYKGNVEMIETITQTKAALEEIKKLTDWNDSRMAEKIGILRLTVHNLLTGKNKDPRMSTMMKIETELKRVRKVHGVKP